ncbi:hypothetical protein NLJ89_g5189 [Agrocybe chaxingu]|uniref:DDE Tnp4 domain-containing protein n=1 Tax=Agrocybe chaxingu TaxID=84603 RepID=A0A9W8JZ15_9AGAR|nr:hypothetical protein NLJ89_g5189 [Agrocybe chaxingu]
MRPAVRNALFQLCLDAVEDTVPIEMYQNIHNNLPPITAAATLLAHQLEDTRETARPQQSGFRITWEALCALDRRDCLYRFRFYAEEIADLVNVLQIPNPCITSGRHSFSSIEALCILLARYKSAGTQNELVIMYRRSQAAISEIVNELSYWIEERWRHLLDFDFEGILSQENMEKYAEAIYMAGAPLDSIWAFLDCTIRVMCRPSRHQRQAYSGYKKRHALKYQALKLPNGLIGHLYGPEVGRHNDNHLLTTSGLMDLCAQHAIRPGTTIDDLPQDHYLQVFGDPAYGNNYQLISPFSGVGERTMEEKAWNEAMSAVRIEVEHGFGGVTKSDCTIL